MDMCITIRTFVLANGRAYLQSGAGIVADSVPEKEYEECLHKARALHHALELAVGMHAEDVAAAEAVSDAASAASSTTTRSAPAVAAEPSGGSRKEVSA
jgi:hypothetical protein